MENTPNLSKIIQSINDILDEHDTKASDIPESLIVYAIVNDAPYMIEDFIEDGFVALHSDSPFGWIKPAYQAKESSADDWHDTGVFYTEFEKGE